MSDIVVKGISPSLASYTYNYILTKLRENGYTIELVGNIEKFVSDNIIPQYIQKYKILACKADDGTIFTFSDTMPLMAVHLLGYEENNSIVFNLLAVVGDDDFDWEGEDDKLYVVRESFLEDAYSDILNQLSDYIIKVDEKGMDISENLNNRLQNAIVRLYEGMYKKLGESVATDNDFDAESAIEDIEVKIDVIMDALGLSDDDDKNDDNNDDNNDNSSEIVNKEDKFVINDGGPDLIEDDITTIDNKPASFDIKDEV